MPLVSTRDMLEKALHGRYAVGAFNVNNLEIAQGVLRACARLRAPVVLQASQGAIKYAGRTAIVALVRTLAAEAGLPVALHLDHGPDLVACKVAIDSGFTSVMFDGSSLPYEENVRHTREVVEYAHPRGVTVEAELGTLAGIEDEVRVEGEGAWLTDPDQAKDFVERTGSDSLAVAIGTSHGPRKFHGKPTLDFDRLAAIERRLPRHPLVLHGASAVPADLVRECNRYGGTIDEGAQGIPDEMIRRAAQGNVCKVNSDTDLRLAFTAAVRRVLAEEPAEFDPRKIAGAARDAIEACVAHRLDVLGCVGKV